MGLQHLLVNIHNMGQTQTFNISQLLVNLTIFLSKSENRIPVWTNRVRHHARQGNGKRLSLFYPSPCVAPPDWLPLPFLVHLTPTCQVSLPFVRCMYVDDISIYMHAIWGHILFTRSSLSDTLYFFILFSLHLRFYIFYPPAPSPRKRENRTRRGGRETKNPF